MRLIESRFREWLEAKPPTEIVGSKKDCCGCPLARFYNDATGNEVVISENGDGYKIDRGYGDRRLPPWAAEFAFQVDGYPFDNISAAVALGLLNERR